MREFRLHAITAILVLCSLAGISQTTNQVQVTRNTNLRAGPSSSDKIIELIRPPEKLDLVDPTPTEEGYYHVRTEEGEEGFVYRRNVKLVPATEAPEGAVSSLLLAAGKPTDAISDQWGKGKPNKITFHGKEGDCAFNGNGFDPDQYALKNRTDAPDSYHWVTWSAIDTLKVPEHAPMHRKDWTAAQLAVIEPFESIPQNGGSGEGTNCKFNQTGDVDTHIAVVEKAGDGEADSIVVEFTPRFLKKHPNWTRAKLAPWLDSENPVRVSGWLMLDPDHAAHLGKYRDTLWEIHPITKFEVFKDGKFVDLDDVTDTGGGLHKDSMGASPGLNARIKAREHLNFSSASSMVSGITKRRRVGELSGPPKQQRIPVVFSVHQ
jgi:hypothetical protein